MTVEFSKKRKKNLECSPESAHTVSFSPFDCSERDKRVVGLLTDGQDWYTCLVDIMGCSAPNRKDTITITQKHCNSEKRF